MDAFLSSLRELAGSLLKVSAQASLLIAVVLLAQWLGGRKLSPRVRYALWLLVVARLLLPVSLESGLSIFNFTTATPAKLFHAVGAALKPSAAKAEVKNAPAPTAPASSAPAPSSAGVPPASAGAKAGETPALPPAPRNERTNRLQAGSYLSSSASVKPFPWATTLTLAWLAGVVFLLARIIWIPLRLNAQLARHETPTARGVFEILEESKRLSGVNRVLPIVQSRAVASPALLGFIRPWLLLPEGLVEKFTPQELRLVFLHELAHLKRRDIAVNWLATLLQILHWPNPLVWLAFARMRADRELACDELALSFAAPEENKTYGHAIIKLLEGFRRPAALPGLVGILEDETQMQKRITMIAQFKKMSGWSAAAASLVLGLGIVTLTDGQTEKATEPAKIFGSNSPTVKILLSGTSADAYGILSPDESAVAYTDWKANGGNLAIRDLRTGETKILAAASGKKDSYEFAMNLVWSSDSKSVAYEWSADDDGVSVRIVARDGGEPKVVRNEKDESFWPSDWSRDGKLLVGEWLHWGQTVRPPELAILNLATGELRSIGPEASHPRFSPNGRFIACERTTNGNRDVFVVSTDGARTTRITTLPAEDGCPIFSPDGRLVLFSSNQRGSWDLWAMKVEDGQPVGAAQPVRYDFGDHHKWITAAGKLVFESSGSGVGNVIWTDVFQIAATRSPLAGEDGPKPVAKTTPGRNVNPAWSPDGKQIAYIRFRGARSWYPLLCVQSLADGTEQTFEPGMRQMSRLFWSPDGQMIAMRGIGEERSGDGGIYVYSLAERRRVSDRINAGWGMGFTSDGKEFIFFRPNKSDRIAVDIATKAERQIPSPPDFATISKTIVNPMAGTWDESVAVYLAKEGTEQQLVVANADFGNKRVIVRVSEPATIGWPSLSPDRKKIAYYIAPGGDSTAHKQLHIAAVDGSWNRVVNTGAKYVFGGPACSWSPDSTKITQTLREDLPGEIGVLENFLPAEKLAAK